MSVIVVQDPLSSKLAAADAPIQICTSGGLVLGYFTPAKTKHIRLEAPANEKELDRREAAGGGRPLADILRDLESRV